jgi:hypothetical protein
MLLLLRNYMESTEYSISTPYSDLYYCCTTFRQTRLSLLRDILWPFDHHHINCRVATALVCQSKSQSLANVSAIR